MRRIKPRYWAAALVIAAGALLATLEQPAPADNPSEQPATTQSTVSRGVVSSAPPVPDKPTEKPTHVKGQLLVRFKPDVSDRDILQVLSRVGGSLIDQVSEVSRLALIRFDRGLSVGEMARRLRTFPTVEYAGPNHYYYIDRIPDDPLFHEQWGLHTDGSTNPADPDIDAAEAWEVFTGNQNVVVGVIDSGIDYRHFDLQPNLWVNASESPGNGLDDDSNGFVDDIHGINAITVSGDPLDDSGHGTHIAGVIGAVGNNRRGTAGVAWQTRIATCKFLDASGRGAEADAIRCFDYFNSLRDKGVRIVAINASWGNATFSTLLADAIERARARNIVLVAAAGNQGSDADLLPRFPAAYPGANILSVGAIDQNGSKTGFSNFGATSVDLFAPGEQILSSWPGDSHRTLSGTSVAAPHVTGIVGLLAADDPTLGPAELVRNVINSATPVESLRTQSVSGGIARLVYPRTDNDNDGIEDRWERRYGLDASSASDANADLDGDGLSNLQEFRLGTSPQLTDTDGDGLSDKREAEETGSEPALADTDSDGLNDSREIQLGTGIRDPDTDDDGMTDGWEVQYGFDPRSSGDGNLDPDGDGASNRSEFDAGSDPRQPDSRPPSQLWSGEHGNASRTSNVQLFNPPGSVGRLWSKQHSFNAGPFRGAIAAGTSLAFSIEEERGEKVLVAIRLADGTEAWRYAYAESYGAVTPVLTARRVITAFNTLRGWTLVGTDLSGGVMYSRELGQIDFRSNLLVAGNTVVVADSGQLLTFDATTGSPRWRASLPGGPAAWYGNLAVSHERIGIFKGQMLYLLSLADGSLVSQIPLSGCSTNGSATVLFDSLGNPFVHIGGCIAAFDSINQRVKWIRQRVSEDFPPSIAGSILLSVEPFNSRVVGLDTATGDVRWSWKSVFHIGTPLVSSLSHFFVGSSGGSTAAVSLATRLTEWETGAQGAMTVSEGGVLLINSLATLAAYHVGGEVDADGDNVTDRLEIHGFGTSPAASDTDRDGVPDDWEIKGGTNPNRNDASQDDDGDTLNNLDEYLQRTLPRNTDSDADGLADGLEIARGTQPLRRDSDRDGLPDGFEVNFSFDPLIVNNRSRDTDGDGFPDLSEARYGSHPRSTASVPKSVPWTGEQGNESHRGFSPLRIDISRLARRWSVRPEPGVADRLGPVAVAHGRLYATYDPATGRNTIVGFNAQSGQRLWRTSIQDANGLSAPSVNGVRLALEARLGANSGKLLSIEGTSGAIRWQSGAGQYATRLLAPLTTPSTVVSRSGPAGELISRDLATGVALWSDNTARVAQASPVIDKGRIFQVISPASDYRSGLMVSDAITGEPVHYISDEQFEDWASTPAAGFDGQVFVTRQNALIAYDQDGREQHWRTYGIFSNFPPVVGLGEIYAVESGALVAYDEWTGAERWRWQGPTPITHPPVATVAHVLVSSDSSLHVVDVNTHQQIWSAPTPGHVSVGDNKLIYVAGPGGEVTAYAWLPDLDLDGEPDAEDDDRDGDGMANAWEVRYGFNPDGAVDGAQDADGDSLSNFREHGLRTLPRVADSDGDGLSDGVEVAQGYDPLDASCRSLECSLVRDSLSTPILKRARSL